MSSAAESEGHAIESKQSALSFCFASGLGAAGIKSFKELDAVRFSPEAKISLHSGTAVTELFSTVSAGSSTTNAAGAGGHVVWGRSCKLASSVVNGRTNSSAKIDCITVRLLFIRLLKLEGVDRKSVV